MEVYIFVYFVFDIYLNMLRLGIGIVGMLVLIVKFLNVVGIVVVVLDVVLRFLVIVDVDDFFGFGSNF